MYLYSCASEVHEVTEILDGTAVAIWLNLYAASVKEKYVGDLRNS
jgi:hypothetical protein